MNENPYNYGEQILCSLGCEEEQNNAHIISCLRTKKNSKSPKYEDFLNGPLNLKIKLFRSFEENNKQEWKTGNGPIYILFNITI